MISADSFNELAHAIDEDYSVSTVRPRSPFINLQGPQN